MIQTETKVFDEKLTQVNLSPTKEVATIEQDDRENHLTKLQGQQTKTLCSRNFQNLKLRLDFVEDTQFYCYSDFT